MIPIMEALEDRSCPAPYQTLTPIRLTPGMVKVWAEPELVEETREALARWDLLLKGRDGTRLVLTNRLGMARIKIVFSPLEAHIAGETRHRINLEGNKILGGWVLVNPEAVIPRLAIVTHELGHLIGLAHSTNRESIMYRSYTGGGLTLEEWTDTKRYRRS